MRRGKGVLGERGDYRPAAGCGRQRGHRGHDLGAAGGPMIDQRERHLAAAILGEAVEHALLRQGIALGLEVGGRDRRPRRHVVKAVAAGAGGRQQQLDRGHLAGEAGEGGAELGQGVDVGGLQQRQQGLADHAPFVAHAAQQQLLALLVGGAEFDVEKDRDEQKDDRQQPGLGRQRPRPAQAAPRPSLVRSSGIQNRRSSGCGRNRGRCRGTSCGYA